MVHMVLGLEVVFKYVVILKRLVYDDKDNQQMNALTFTI